MAEPIVIDVNLGIVPVIVRDEKKRTIAEFEINPADSNLIFRVDKAVEAFNNLKVDEDKLHGEDNEERRRLCAIIGQQFDYLLGYPVSAELFADEKTGMFSVGSDGEWFFVQVFEGIVSAIEKITNKRVSKSVAKAKRAAAKYQK